MTKCGKFECPLWGGVRNRGCSQLRGLTYLAQSLSCIQISRVTSPARIRVSSYHCARLQASTFERIRIIAYDLSITNSSPFESLSDQSLTHSSEFKYPTRSLLSKFESPTRLSRTISPFRVRVNLNLPRYHKLPHLSELQSPVQSLPPAL